MHTEMKRLVLFFLFINLTYFSFAQNSYLLVRVTPTEQKALLTIEQLEQLSTKSTGNSIAFGILSDGSGMIILKTEASTWNIEFKNYTVYTSPLTINYNVLCKVARDNIPLMGTFIQYNTNITKFNVQQVPVLQSTHYSYLKQLKNIGSVLLEGHFNNDDGGLMLMEGEVDNEVVFLDPTIQSGFMSPEIHNAKFINMYSCE